MRARVFHEGQPFDVTDTSFTCLLCGYESPDSTGDESPVEVEIARHWRKCPENINRALGAPEPG